MKMDHIDLFFLIVLGKGGFNFFNMCFYFSNILIFAYSKFCDFGVTKHS